MIPTVKTWRATFTKEGQVIGVATVFAPTAVLARLNLIHGTPSYWRWMLACDKLSLGVVRKRCNQ
jgi:hypothetical protein